MEGSSSGRYETTLRGLLLRRELARQEAMSQRTALSAHEYMLRAFLLTREEARQLREELLWTTEEDTAEALSQEDALRRQVLRSFAHAGLSKFNLLSTDDEDVCAICLCEVDGDAITTGCKHRFHQDCISRCLLQNTACPMCRADMSDYGVKKVRRSQ